MGLFSQSSHHEIEALQEGIRRSFERLERLESAPTPVLPTGAILEAAGPLLDALRERLALLETLPPVVEALEQKIKEFTFAIAEGIERVDRAERRIHATIKRARKELADSGVESPGLEAENHELSPIDGSGGPGVGVQPLRAGVERVEEASSVEGVSVAELRSVNSRRLRLYE